MAATDEDFAEVERAYRKARWTILGHVIFLAAVCLPAVFLRRLFKMPPALLGVAFIVALIVFGNDIMHFLRCRDRLRQFQRS